MGDKFEEITSSPAETEIENKKELRQTKNRVRRPISHLIKDTEVEKKEWGGGKRHNA